jgi:hypothetical protein
MLPRIISARYVDRYVVWLHFADGAEGTVDLSEELNGPIFEPLRDLEAFSKLSLHPELRTLVWPNGADIAPEFLRSRLQAAAMQPASDS